MRYRCTVPIRVSSVTELASPISADLRRRTTCTESAPVVPNLVERQYQIVFPSRLRGNETQIAIRVEGMASVQIAPSEPTQQILDLVDLTVDQSILTADDQETARQEDRQGLGLSRRQGNSA